MWIKDPDPVFYPDPDPGAQKRPDPDADPQHCLKRQSCFLHSYIGQSLETGYSRELSDLSLEWNI